VSPVIILGLVLMWAIVLVPMWLRRHDEAEENRSVNQFSTAMRTLSRRESDAGSSTQDAASSAREARSSARDARSSAREARSSARDGRYVLMPHRSRAMDVHVSGASAAQDEPVSTSVAESTAGRSRRTMTAAQRRRRTLVGLMVATVGILVLAIIVGGALVWLPQVVLDLALVGFVVHLRNRAARAAAVSRQRRRVAVAPSWTAEPAAASAGYDAASYAGGTATSYQPVAVEPEPDYELSEYVAQSLAAYAELDDAALDAEYAAEEAGGAWDPVPVPRPTYTMKPAAPARRRKAARLADPAAAEADSYGPAAAGELDEGADDAAALDDILTYRRAVND
jgi:hypothetical protein